jgi:uncharacterized membrane protein (UPF0136 family)
MGQEERHVSTASHQIRLLARSVVGFFVDDGINALLTIAWIGIIFAIARVIPGQAWQGVLLAVGLSALFVISIIVRVRQMRRRVPCRDDISGEIVSVTAEE